MPELLKKLNKLAQKRTSLANERTLLAYLRTALAFIVTGLIVLKLFDTMRYIVFISISIGVLIFALGIYSYHTRNNRIKSTFES